MNLFTIFGEVNLVSPLEIGHKTISIGSLAFNQHKKKALEGTFFEYIANINS